MEPVESIRTLVICKRRAFVACDWWCGDVMLTFLGFLFQFGFQFPDCVALMLVNLSVFIQDVSAKTDLASFSNHLIHPVHV